MESSEFINIGPLQLSINLIILIGGILVASIATELIARKKGWDKGKWSDFLILHFFVFLLVYKFGWIIFDLAKLFQDPQALIWSSGSILSAVVVTALVYIYKILRNKSIFIEIFDLSWLTAVIVLLVYNLFLMDYGKTTNFLLGVSISENSTNLYHPVNWYKAILLAIALIIRFKLRQSLNYYRLFYLYILPSIGLLLLITIYDLPLNLVLGFSYEQWMYILLILFGGIGIILTPNDSKTKT